MTVSSKRDEGNGDLTVSDKRDEGNGDLTVSFTVNVLGSMLLFHDGCDSMTGFGCVDDVPGPHVRHN